MSACAGSLTNASCFSGARKDSVACGQGIIWHCFGSQEQDFLRNTPAWSRWIAPGRIGFMSTQRRDIRSAPTTETGRLSTRHGSRLALCKNLANRANQLGQANAVLPSRVFPAFASGQTAYLPAKATRSTLQQDTRSDTRNQQSVRSFGLASPPVWQAAGLEAFCDRPIGYLPLPSPAFFARVHPTLPHVPAAFSCRTERYDGKGNLYFKHAA